MFRSSDRHMDAQSQSTLFTKLPAELRHHIFEFVLYVDNPENSGIKVKKRPSRSARPTVLHVLETCRRARWEAEELFYALNRISYPLHNFIPFLASLTPRRLAALRHLRLDALSPHIVYTAVATCRASLPHLESLHIVEPAGLGWLIMGLWVRPKSRGLPIADVLISLKDLRVLRFFLLIDGDARVAHGRLAAVVPTPVSSLRKTMRTALEDLCAEVKEGKSSASVQWTGTAEVVTVAAPAGLDAWEATDDARGL